MQPIAEKTSGEIEERLNTVHRAENRQELRKKGPLASRPKGFCELSVGATIRLLNYLSPAFGAGRPGCENNLLTESQVQIEVEPARARRFEISSRLVAGRKAAAFAVRCEPQHIFVMNFPSSRESPVERTLSSSEPGGLSHLHRSNNPNPRRRSGKRDLDFASDRRHLK